MPYVRTNQAVYFKHRQAKGAIPFDGWRIPPVSKEKYFFDFFTGYESIFLVKPVLPYRVTSNNIEL